MVGVVGGPGVEVAEVRSGTGVAVSEGASSVVEGGSRTRMTGGFDSTVDGVTVGSGAAAPTVDVSATTTAPASRPLRNRGVDAVATRRMRPRGASEAARCNSDTSVR